MGDTRPRAFRVDELDLDRADARAWSEGTNLNAMVADWVHEYGAKVDAGAYESWKRNQRKKLERWERRQAGRDAG